MFLWLSRSQTPVDAKRLANRTALEATKQRSGRSAQKKRDKRGKAWEQTRHLQLLWDVFGDSSSIHNLSIIILSYTQNITLTLNLIDILRWVFHLSTSFKALFVCACARVAPVAEVDVIDLEDFDAWEVLDLSPDADKQKIRRRFRKLVAWISDHLRSNKSKELGANPCLTSLKDVANSSNTSHCLPKKFKFRTKRHIWRRSIVQYLV